MHRIAVPMAEPFFKRLHELHPQYQSLGGHAVRPMRTLDGRNLGGLSSHASGYTLDIKAPDNVLRQIAQEFPQVRWGGNFKSHYDPVHFEFKPGAAPIGVAASASPAPGGGLSGASPPMALSNAYVSPQEQPGYLDRVLNSPLFMMGASVLGAPNIGTGLMQGARASQDMQLGGMKMAQFRDAQAERQRQRQMWESVTQGSHPLLSAVPQEMRQALSVMDPETGMKTLQNFALTNHANAQKRSDPMYAAQLAQTQAHTKLYEAQANAKDTPDQAFRLREQEAQRLGLQPGSPAYQSYVLTGKMPREDQQPLTATDKKAILEADEGVQAAQNAIRGLDQALKLSKEAYSGMGAGVLGTVVDKAVPWATPGATATTQLDQVVTSQALEQLKSLFGAAPTEGERKILLDIQGSVSQSQAAREAIYKRAREAALRRLEFNKQRAAAMRNQTYYQSNGGPQQTQTAPLGDNDPLGIR